MLMEKEATQGDLPTDMGTALFLSGEEVGQHRRRKQVSNILWKRTGKVISVNERLRTD